jgi:hypothetical protein
MAGESVSSAWFNPRTGETTRIGDFTEKKRYIFDPPADGDWVLVLDDSARGFRSAPRAR